MLHHQIVFRACLFVATCTIFLSACQQKNRTTPPLYQYSEEATTRWSSPENRNGQEGSGAQENAGAKGHPYDQVKAHMTDTLLNVTGPGVISRMWLTVRDRSPEMLRSLKLEIFWDNEIKPAVAAPLGDFFGVGLGRTAAFHNVFFVDPEGRSFVCLVPMPFKSAARILVTNESDKDLSHLYFDIDFQSTSAWDERNLYFHTYWSRDTATVLVKDFAMLPFVKGKGRYLGVNVGIHANPAYRDAWWGEGEVKIFLDEDASFPSLAGTGTEDYIGTGWGQGAFFNEYSGCTIADEPNLQWTFYRFHVPDPVFFNRGCRVTLQQIGGNMKSKVLELQKANVPLVPVTVDDNGNLIHLYTGKRELSDPSLPEGWTNFYRSDDISATAYFYLDLPVSNLPALQPVSLRTVKLK
jgi:hypothetical protein